MKVNCLIIAAILIVTSTQECRAQSWHQLRSAAQQSAEDGNCAEAILLWKKALRLLDGEKDPRYEILFAAIFCDETMQGVFGSSASSRSIEKLLANLEEVHTESD